MNKTYLPQTFYMLVFSCCTQFIKRKEQRPVSEVKTAKVYLDFVAWSEYTVTYCLSRLKITCTILPRCTTSYKNSCSYLYDFITQVRFSFCWIIMCFNHANPAISIQNTFTGQKNVVQSQCISFICYLKSIKQTHNTQKMTVHPSTYFIWKQYWTYFN
jgi:hypothetical protein